jgi:TolA-binding protein
LIYDIGDYAMKHSQSDRLIAVADLGEKAAPSDPRGKFYRAVALIIKNDKTGQPETLLREYLKTAPTRNGYPRPRDAHEWLGRYYENQNKSQAAIAEYEAALKLDPHSHAASDALKRLKKS